MSDGLGGDAEVESSHAEEDCRIRGRVKANQSLGAMVRVTIEVAGWRGAQPGQFALLQSEGSRCFLARALSVSDEAEGDISFVIAPIGEGTRELCDLAIGGTVWVLGPLGNGFDIEALFAGGGRVVIVAGGAGVAPFPLLLSRMGERYRCLTSGPRSADHQLPGDVLSLPYEVLMLAGFRDGIQCEALKPIHEAAALMGRTGLRYHLETVTEDGSCGRAEKVTDLLRRHVRPGDRVAVCGPRAMCVAVWDICSKMADVETWFSLEAGMACGVGSCHGCAVRLAGGSWTRVCREGPVFSGREVFGA